MISKKLLALFLFVAAIAAAVLLFSSTVDYHGSGAVSAAEGLGSVDQSVVALRSEDSAVSSAAGERQLAQDDGVSRIALVVSSESGAPVASARVYAKPQARLQDDLHWIGETDARGVLAVAAGKFPVIIDREGYAPLTVVERNRCAVGVARREALPSRAT